MPSRRDFLKSAAGSVLIAGSLPGLVDAAVARSNSAATKPLNILVLGGTGFIGPHLVRYAVSRGHRVTIFTRGRHDAELPDEVVRLQGDRNGQLDALRANVGRRRRRLGDESRLGRAVDRAAQGSVGAYLFTSSTGVYYPYLKRGARRERAGALRARRIRRTAPRRSASRRRSASAGDARCSATAASSSVRRTSSARATRPTAFRTGPCVWRAAAKCSRRARATIRCRSSTCATSRSSWCRLLENETARHLQRRRAEAAAHRARVLSTQAAKALDAKVRYTYVDDYDFLAAHKIDEAIPWALLKGNDYGMMSVKNDKAIAAGLTFRPLATTVRDTLAWWPTVPQARRDKPQLHDHARDGSAGARRLESEARLSSRCGFVAVDQSPTDARW